METLAAGGLLSAGYFFNIVRSKCLLKKRKSHEEDTEHDRQKEGRTVSCSSETV